MKKHQIIDTLKYEENIPFLDLLDEDLTEANNTKNMRSYAAKKRGLKLLDFKNSIQAAVQVDIQLSYRELENSLIFFKSFKKHISANDYDYDDFKDMMHKSMVIGKSYVNSLIIYQSYIKGNIRALEDEDKTRIDLMFVEEIKERISLEANRFPQIYQDKNINFIGKKILRKFVGEIDPKVFDKLMEEIVKDTVKTIFKNFIEVLNKNVDKY
ncbi:hypothetical protein H5203_21985 [Pseudoalteromonas sp. SG41-1]|uniref:hypothetical protein n=1 Tax=Pseudoalteromonas sp. SG41-1 TaxID=2760979 RepID=UPI0015FF84F8|nr:hypothetical protein [Pseudoalteromonas sp. SG41-1]MBB1508107.1 hypothetical protein [Pseudoalteromonas sp. SG41-1]